MLKNKNKVLYGVKDAIIGDKNDDK